MGDADIDRTIAILLALPAREPEDPDARKVLKQLFREAIIDAPLAALGLALQSVARGGLGHAFRPSPPEFRILIDKIAAMDRRAEESARREAEAANPQPIVGAEFPASFQDIEKQIDRLSGAMSKPRGFSADDQRTEYQRTLRGLKLGVVIDTIDRIIDGRVERKTSVMPRPAELGQIARQIAAENDKASSRQMQANGRVYRYKVPRSKPLMENVFKDEMRSLVDNGVLPRGSIWMPGGHEHPGMGTAYAPDPEWHLPVPV